MTPLPGDALEVDLQLLRSWWSALAVKVPTDVAALWFGMTDLVGHEGPKLTLYVAGCPTFDPKDESAEWATEYSWWPEDRYVELPGLAAIPSSAYLDALQYATTLIDMLRPEAALNIVGCAVGFDDGDFEVTWTA